MRSSAKYRSEKCEIAGPDTLLPKLLCTADAEISGRFIIQILLLWSLIYVYVKDVQVKFKADCVIK